jgi:hypothetical protein
MAVAGVTVERIDGPTPSGGAYALAIVDGDDAKEG